MSDRISDEELADHISLIVAIPEASRTAMQKEYLLLLMDLRDDREVIGKLPVTADGVPITPRMVCYAKHWQPVGDYTIQAFTAISGFRRGDYIVDQVYSTREAAAAALAADEQAKDGKKGGAA